MNDQSTGQTIKEVKPTGGVVAEEILLWDGIVWEEVR